MKNNKILILALFIGFSSRCFAEPLSIDKIKKQRDFAIIQQSKQIDENNLKHGYFGLKNNSYFEVVAGEKDYDFLNITTQIEFTNFFSTYCRDKTNGRCLKTSDFKDFQQAIEITRKFYKKLEEIRVETEAITIFINKLTLKPKDFLNYWKKTSNVAYVRSTIYYKKELGENYIYTNIVETLIDQIMYETRAYVDELADLLKDSSKKRILGYTYITDIVTYIN